MAAFHRIFSFSLQRVGGFARGATPVESGPLHWPHCALGFSFAETADSVSSMPRREVKKATKRKVGISDTRSWVCSWKLGTILEELWLKRQVLLSRVLSRMRDSEGGLISLTNYNVSSGTFELIFKVHNRVRESYRLIHGMTP